MVALSPGRALRASHKPWKWLGFISGQSNYCSSFAGRFPAFWAIIMSLASCRHERINTRKTLIIESCPDDDLVNLEFLDQVRYNVFISLCIDRTEVQSCWFHAFVFSYSSLQETIISHLQKRYDELQVYTYVGDILIALNPFQNLSIYSPQVGYRPVTQMFPVVAQSEWLLTSHATGSASVNIHITFIC